MRFVLKLLVTNVIIVVCARIGVKSPSLGGLIVTMPLTSLLVLLWLRTDQPGNSPLLVAYTRGVLWGIIPTVLFFLALHLCLRRELAFPLALAAASGVWFAGALVHHWFMK
jgi:uncharacterized membrane protein (GlpM family)